MTEAGPEPESLLCPRCGSTQRPSERFCPGCGMPLVLAGPREQQPSSEAHERARKVHPRFARGEPVRVTGARNLAEAELIQGMLLEQGIPSVLRRTRGFDVPDFLAAGPRDVLVPASGFEAARTLLRDADLLTGEAAAGSLPGIGSPGRLAAGVLIGVGLAGALVWALYQLTG